MTWTGMEKLVEKGLAKNIGLSNFNSKQTQDILDMCKVKLKKKNAHCMHRASRKL